MLLSLLRHDWDLESYWSTTFFFNAMNNHSSFSHWEWFLPEKLFTTQSPLHLIYEFVFVHSYMVYIWLSQYNRFHNPFPLKSACLSTLSLSYCSPIMTPTLFLWLPKPVFMMVLWVINIWEIIYVRVQSYMFFSFKGIMPMNNFQSDSDLYYILCSFFFF